MRYNTPRKGVMPQYPIHSRSSNLRTRWSLPFFLNEARSALRLQLHLLPSGGVISLATPATSISATKRQNCQVVSFCWICQLLGDAFSLGGVEV